mmetsp:Transcript_9497/g.17334  ORF Transcript_9497/g.17334 Transcript_9497/m.17334 type:complete len:210 (-) Transcript_9497:202-831(-)
MGGGASAAASDVVHIQQTIVSHHQGFGFDEDNKIQDNLDDIDLEDHAPKKQIQELHKRFQAIDEDGDGNITVFEFLSVPELVSNPLAFRIYALCSLDGNNNIKFTEFAKGLQIFSPQTSMAAKVAFLFRLFDVDSDSYVGHGDLLSIFAYLSANGYAFSQPTLRKNVDVLINRHDKKGNGKLDLNEFATLVQEDAPSWMRFVDIWEPWF